MRVQERPHELPAHILEPKFKMRVLKYGVMPAVERRSADVDSLLVGDFFRADQSLRIAGSRRGDRRIIRVRERVAQSHHRRSAIDQLSGTRRIKHAGLGSHSVDHSTPLDARTNSALPIQKQKADSKVRPLVAWCFSLADRYNLLWRSNRRLDLRSINRVRQIEIDRQPLLAEAKRLRCQPVRL